MEEKRKKFVVKIKLHEIYLQKNWRKEDSHHIKILEDPIYTKIDIRKLLEKRIYTKPLASGIIRSLQKFNPKKKEYFNQTNIDVIEGKDSFALKLSLYVEPENIKTFDHIEIVFGKSRQDVLSGAKMIISIEIEKNLDIIHPARYLECLEYLERKEQPITPTFDDIVNKIKPKKILEFRYLLGDMGNEDEEIIEKRREYLKDELSRRIIKRDISEDEVDQYMAAWAKDMTKMKLNDFGIIPERIRCIDINNDPNPDCREIQDLATIQVDLDENTKLSSLVELLKGPGYSSVPGISASEGTFKIDPNTGVVKSEILLFTYLQYKFDEE